MPCKNNLTSILNRSQLRVRMKRTENNHIYISFYLNNENELFHLWNNFFHIVVGPVWLHNNYAKQNNSFFFYLSHIFVLYMMKKGAIVIISISIGSSGVIKMKQHIFLAPCSEVSWDRPDLNLVTASYCGNRRTRQHYIC